MGASIPFYLYNGYLYNWRDDFLKSGLGFIMKFVWRVIADKRYNLKITLVCAYDCVLTGTCWGVMQNDIFTLPCSKYSENKIGKSLVELHVCVILMYYTCNREWLTLIVLCLTGPVIVLSLCGLRGIIVCVPDMREMPLLYWITCV